MEIRKIKEINLVKNIVLFAEDKKAENILVLNISKISNFCNYFIIMTATAETHVKTLGEYIPLKIKENFNIKPFHVEGKLYNKWVVLDFGGVIVHIMLEEVRKFYALEHIWVKGKVVNFKKSRKKTR